MQPKEEESWVKCSDRLPEKTLPAVWWDDETDKLVPYRENDHAIVLAYDPEKGIIKARYNNMGWYEISSCSISGCKPTHWMPLPETPTDIN